MSERIVIALVGEIASGKGVVVEYLKSQGFEDHSLSTRVREEVARRGLEPNRKTLQDIGNDLRHIHGPDILAKRTTNIVNPTKNLVIDGVRNPSEIIYLKKKLDASVIGVIASYEHRLQRYLQRAAQRHEDTATAESFRLSDLRDHGIGENPNGQQVQACLDMADVIINNDSTIDAFIIKLEEVISTRLRYDSKANF